MITLIIYALFRKNQPERSLPKVVTIPLIRKLFFLFKPLIYELEFVIIFSIVFPQR